jgi:hypothetical protein
MGEAGSALCRQILTPKQRSHHKQQTSHTHPGECLHGTPSDLPPPAAAIPPTHTNSTLCIHHRHPCAPCVRLVPAVVGRGRSTGQQQPFVEAAAAAVVWSGASSGSRRRIAQAAAARWCRRQRLPARARSATSVRSFLGVSGRREGRRREDGMG